MTSFGSSRWCLGTAAVVLLLVSVGFAKPAPQPAPVPLLGRMTLLK